MPAGVDILDHGKIVAITRDSGERHRFHAIWLRDNAWDDKTRSPGNGQRLITLGDIPADTVVSEADINGDRLQLTFQPEGRTIAFDAGWLADKAYDNQPTRNPGWTAPQIETWDSALADRIPVADFSEVSRDRQALAAWLAGVRRYGFGKLNGGPVKPEALLQVAALFGYVRETNYGTLVRGPRRGQPEQPRLHQPRPAGAHRQSLPRSCADAAAPGLPGKLRGGRRLHRGRRLPRRRAAAGEENPHGFDLLTRYCARFEYAGQPASGCGREGR